MSREPSPPSDPSGVPTRSVPEPSPVPPPVTEPPPLPDRFSTLSADQAESHRTDPYPAAANVAAGQEPVPGFRLEKLLGRGGFGEVWKAASPGGMTVAMKFLPLGAEASRIELRALQLVKDVRHAHLLALFGVWQVQHYLIIAMELADTSLYDLHKQTTAKNGPGLEPAQLLDFMEEAAKGIDYLNSLKIQHRDIKPHNLLLVGGSVKVGDFGLAKVLEHSMASQSGKMTVAYAAPEFFHRKTYPASDQYSLAVSYCQLRGNLLPFRGSFAEMLMGHLHQEPDLSMLPESERNVVARALAKEAKDRWPSCRDFVQALRQQEAGGSVPSPTKKKRPKQPVVPTAPAPGVQTWLDKARRNHELAGWEEALEAFSRALHMDPKYGPAYAGRALVHVDQHQLHEARADCERARQLAPGDAQVWYAWGYLALHQGHDTEALRCLRRAQKLDRRHLPTLLARAQVHRSLGQQDRATVLYEQAWKRVQNAEHRFSPEYVEASLGLAQCGQRTFLEVLADTRDAIQRHPRQFGLYLLRARVARQLEQYDQAVQDCTKALVLNPRCLVAWLMRGNCHLLRKPGPALADSNRNKAQAVADFTEALRLDKTCVEAYLMRGVANAQRNEWFAGVADLTQAIELDPRQAEAYYARGDIYLNLLNQPGQAIQDHATAVRLAPDNVKYQLALANAFLDLDKPYDALRHFTEAIRINPQNPVAHHNRGSAYSQLMRWEDALRDYSTAIDLRPNEYSFYLLRADVLDQLGQTDLAQDDRRYAETLQHEARP